MTEELLTQVLELLRTTDLPMLAIDEQLGLRRGRTCSINRKYRVRRYGNKRLSFLVDGERRNTQ